MQASGSREEPGKVIAAATSGGSGVSSVAADDGCEEERGEEDCPCREGHAKIQIRTIRIDEEAQDQVQRNDAVIRLCIFWERPPPLVMMHWPRVVRALIAVVTAATVACVVLALLQQTSSSRRLTGVTQGDGWVILGGESDPEAYEGKIYSVGGLHFQHYFGAQAIISTGRRLLDRVLGNPAESHAEEESSSS